MTPDTSGPTLRVPLAHYDPDSSSWKTSGVMFPSDWPTSSETCPAWGMTRAGELFELPTPALPTDAPASSSSLLPTPVADHSRGLPQPGTDFQSLPNAVISLLPTPAVNDMGAGKTPQEWDAWTARMQARHGNGNGHGASLSIEALRLLPTPRATDGTKGGPNQRGSSGDLMLPSAVQQFYRSASGRIHLKPQYLRYASGATTPPPFTDGNASSDDPRPTPPNPDATDDPDCLPFSSSG